MAKQALYRKLKSNLDSTLVAFVAPASTISPTETAQQIIAIGVDYVEKFTTVCSKSEKESDQMAYGPCSPGLSEYTWELWELVIQRVYNAPIEERAFHEYITRLVNLVGQLQNTSGEGRGWFLPHGKFTWKELPDLGSVIREAYNEPISTAYFSPASLITPKAQSAVAGISLLETLKPGSVHAKLALGRHKWLSLQHFISRLWRDCGRNEYALYAIWVVRAGLEYWPNAPSEFRPSTEFERSAAYLAFQVEAVAIWICNTAPLMYKCTEIWGPNGNPDWPQGQGPAGRGGERWNGVDGYDREHKRWQLWKDILGEVIQWCDTRHASNWKVKNAALHALEAMNQAEQL